MNFTPAGKNLMLDSLTGPITASIHTADPTDAGTFGELSGGSPAYARKTITFDAADAGNRNATVLPTFDIPPASNISHAALWQGATCIATGPLSATENFTAQGQYTLTDADLTLQDVV